MPIIGSRRAILPGGVRDADFATIQALLPPEPG
jgi:hypothetical protein